MRIVADHYAGDLYFITADIEKRYHRSNLHGRREHRRPRGEDRGEAAGERRAAGDGNEERRCEPGRVLVGVQVGGDDALRHRHAAHVTGYSRHADEVSKGKK